jgi:hypothetical protein
MSFEEKKVTLVFEINCYEESSKSSIWLVPLILHEEAEEDDEPYYYEAEGAFKVIGPIDTDMCVMVQDAIVNMLNKIGFEVAQMTTADD